MKHTLCPVPRPENPNLPFKPATPISIQNAASTVPPLTEAAIAKTEPFDLN
ncbi:hypothetical protein N9L87_00995 [Rhodobacteraceae bacterium]|nr:hypothetical protein [Paracoccaceae bacterium]